MSERTLNLSLGASRKATSWTPATMTWAELADRLGRVIRGSESHTAYMRMPKAEQDRLKDVGGFVGGTLRGGQRKAANVTGRDLVTLDFDALPEGGTDGLLSRVSALGCAACVYSTRKHDPAHPRLRVVLPLARTVTGEEYEPVARRVAEWLGIEHCDPTTFQACRLMYWPSASADSAVVYDLDEGAWLDPDDVLRGYRDWRDMRDWPQVPGQAAVQRAAAQKQEDPAAKSGIVGAFCREYPILRAMDELIPGVYEPTDAPDRYTYTGGSTAGGAIVYDDKWLYSHHATDPCGGRLVNSWDLVRLHKFADRDADAAPDTPVNKLPSTAAMRELALSLPAVRLRSLNEARTQITADFGTADPDGDWRLQLKMDAQGRTLGTLVNLKMIFDNDPELQCVGNDTFLGQGCVYGALPWDKRTQRRPWTDSDDTGAAWYMEAEYGIKDLRRIKLAADAAMDARRHDALKEYLEGLAWDGVPRVDTLLIRYFHADDTPYTRAVTRKFMAGAVARGMEPGCKFDSVLTLVGAQGTGKSMFADILGGDWYNDNIQTFVGKEAAEQLRGVWIVEIPEVDRFSTKFEASAVKQFITRRDDIYRVPFERRTTPHPRRCVFLASTNAPEFLTDTTGNRRWWIVRCHVERGARGEDLAGLRRDRDQVWAEAVALWRAGETLTLPADLAAEAVLAQADAVVTEPWEGLITDFAARPVPLDWDARSPEDRMLWWSDEYGQQGTQATAPRKKLCAVEVWHECFGRELSTMDSRSSRRIMAVLRHLEGWSDGGSRKTVYGSQRCVVRDEILPLEATTKTTKTTKTS